ncbi:hypothetical protein SAMN02949497_3460 [Methylomagnum ishizawai]|uniref:DUF488 domain-containing protein n=1 Tax=Methylomagnum ishizawai TaxID=1760988 RepID=A0A1Y6CZG3_9GAMM|nr:DUF488 family protein [Methylomagnum ishizawai]SMF96079.1 hypothetical protein SAMN02949497_3460 [Methylomagnum ishizawai]
MAGKTLYTAGYGAGWTPETLDAAMIERGAVLVDIRRLPWSTQSTEWTRSRLLARFGKMRYAHFKSLGNLSRKGDPIALVDADNGIRSLAAILNWPGIDAMVLLCGCRDVHTCHRKVVAELAAERLGDRFALRIEHLEPTLATDPDHHQRGKNRREP